MLFYTSLHLNICSLKNHCGDLQEYLSPLNLSFSVIALSETWLDEISKDLHNLPGYNLFPTPIITPTNIETFGYCLASIDWTNE